ncbi:MAG: S46 family peptidase [Hyphomonadaceae bacterium JAD_PAG50586_4]|nr:MAG: S46 family peptidase [Hyphomonadaceae bacterium JAD_PAG50586_4]
MTMKKCALIGCLFLALTGAASAEEGMWLPSQTPALAPALRQAGLELDPAVLGDLSRPPWNAIVSLGGCSAAFVSAQGLIATNHHCVAGSIQYNSSEENNYLRDGFLAAELGDEAPAAPGSRVFVIDDLRDVTREMNRGVSARLDGSTRYNRLEANRVALIDACERQPNRRCDVRAYYGGAVYYLQQQLEIRDVRLVYAPAEGIGNFGGETDNWQWPRHTGDFGFYRAYVAPDGSSATFSESNVPYRPRSWLRIASEGVREGDFIMVAGFPGTTDRLRTAAEADFYYRDYYPLQQGLLSEYSDEINRATLGDEAATIRYASILRGADNYKKKLLGQIAGAERVRLVERKSEQEQAFRAWVAASGTRARTYEPVITALDRLIEESNQAAASDLRGSVLNRAQLLFAARRLYRWAQERGRPDAEREPGYRDRDRQNFIEYLRQIERRYEPGVDRRLLEQALLEYRQLPTDRRNQALERRLGRLVSTASMPTRSLATLQRA